MTHNELGDHLFTQSVFDAVRLVMAAEREYQQRHGRDMEYILNEHEFYVMRVGNRVASLLSHCEQLVHSIFFLSNYRETPTMSRVGITRTKHLRYGIESYIVRTQTLYDLVLKLVDAVFHLTNADSQYRHSTIVQNMKVKQTDIPKFLKRLKKKLDQYRDARHAVIHHGRHQEEDLYRLELYSELEEDYRRMGQDIPLEFSFLPETKRELIRELIKKRKTQYSRFNSTAFQHISDILAALHEWFTKEEHQLRLLNQ